MTMIVQLFNFVDFDTTKSLKINDMCNFFVACFNSKNGI